VDELSPAHELRLVDRRPMSGRRTWVVDLGQPRPAGRWWTRLTSPGAGDRWTAAFEGADVVLHLAAQASWSASWEDVLHNNVRATWNVLHTATAHGVKRIVFASSTWAVKALERALAPGCYAPGGPKIGPVDPRPLAPYGLSKAIGEQMGRTLVDEGRLTSFLTVRIGHHEPTPPGDEELRRLWVGTRDLRAMLRRCVEAEVGGYRVLYAVSAQRTNPYDLTDARALLGWSPEQRP
jgi:nucleoside-diphosphate-sugar epimerase